RQRDVIVSFPGAVTSHPNPFHGVFASSENMLSAMLEIILLKKRDIVSVICNDLYENIRNVTSHMIEKYVNVILHFISEILCGAVMEVHEINSKKSIEDAREYCVKSNSFLKHWLGKGKGTPVTVNKIQSRVEPFFINLDKLIQIAHGFVLDTSQKQLYQKELQNLVSSDFIFRENVVKSVL
ncbi:hypothetical protein ADUPG1_003435, partial [Aduncisulcus paluster]